LQLRIVGGFESPRRSIDRSQSTPLSVDDPPLTPAGSARFERRVRVNPYSRVFCSSPPAAPAHVPSSG